MARRTTVVGGAISVDGLDEAIKGLNASSKTIGRAVSKKNRELIDRTIYPEAVKNWRSQRIKPSVANSVIKRSGTQKYGQIGLIYTEFPYAAGVEFGSWAYKQFRPWRGNQWTVDPGTSTGYVVQDAIRDKLPELEPIWMDEIVAEINKAIDRAAVG